MSTNAKTKISSYSEVESYKQYTLKIVYFFRCSNIYANAQIPKQNPKWPQQIILFEKYHNTDISQSNVKSRPKNIVSSKG